MLKRLEADYRSQITFTSDMHELVTGNLKPGATLRLSYDPQRIVPHGDPYVFGDPNRPVTAFVRFGATTPVVQAVLSSPGVSDSPDRDVTGQGSMLKVRIDIPADAEMLSIWFKFTGIDGTDVFDSDFGSNFNFRFPEHDVWNIETDVTLDPVRNVGLFHLRLSTSPAAEGVTVRLGRVGAPRTANHELPLEEIVTADSGQRKDWAISDVLVPSPKEAVTEFKIFYWIDGIRFKDDNTGHYFLSPPPPPEHVPPPPPELALAAQAWK